MKRYEEGTESITCVVESRVMGEQDRRFVLFSNVCRGVEELVPFVKAADCYRNCFQGIQYLPEHFYRKKNCWFDGWQKQMLLSVKICR